MERLKRQNPCLIFFDKFSIYSWPIYSRQNPSKNRINNHGISLYIISFYFNLVSRHLQSQYILYTSPSYKLKFER